MTVPRVIPALLWSGEGLVKTRRFEEPLYLGDPCNVLRIFNDRECDEVLLVDIDAARSRRPPRLAALAEIVGEAFMPMAYGGGIDDLATARAVVKVGVEKVVVNSSAVRKPGLITEISDALGRSTVVVSIDARLRLSGRYEVVVGGGKIGTGLEPQAVAAEAARRGAGEILITSVDREGTGLGYDLALVRSVAAVVDVPVIAHGGAGNLRDMVAAVRDGGASAVAAGRIFVLYGRHDAVLVSYPERGEVERVFAEDPR
jgi:cyclase